MSGWRRFHLVAYVGLRRGEAVRLGWQDVTWRPASCAWRSRSCSWATPPPWEHPRPRAACAPCRSTRRPSPCCACTGRRRRPTGWPGVLRGRTPASCSPVKTARSCTLPSSRTFCRLASRVGLPAIRLHDLRQASASLGLASGDTLVEVSRRLGHSSITITADTYTRVLPAVASQSSEPVGSDHPKEGARTFGLTGGPDRARGVIHAPPAHSPAGTTPAPHRGR